MSEVPEELVKITSGGTISIPKQFRRYLEMQKGDYLKIGLEGDHLVVRKVRISWFSDSFGAAFVSFRVW